VPEPKLRRKFAAVPDGFIVALKAHLKAVEGALGVFHIEEVRLQHSSILRRRAPSSVNFDPH
jgi:hypothetical protein